MTLEQIELVFAGRNPVYWPVLWANTDETTYMSIASNYESLEADIWNGSIACEGIVPTPTYPRPTSNHP